MPYKILSIGLLIFLLVLAVVFSLNVFTNTNENIECKNCNIVLISIDALRADHLGIYGYERNTSPNIDDFFKKGFVFENAFSQAPNTLPSHMSIFTGLYPSHHKMFSSSIGTNSSLSDLFRTITEILKIYGYKTQGFYGGGDHLDPKLGFSRGFDKYEVNDFVENSTELFDFLNLNRNGKFFIFMHTNVLHDPYVSIPPFDSMFDKDYTGNIIGNAKQFSSMLLKNNISNDYFNNYNQIRTFYWSRVNKSDSKDVRHLIALYDGNMNMVDSFLGKFFKYLDSLNLSSNTIIVITSDHGEEFKEHNGFVHEKLYDETIHVPLLIYVPHSKPQNVKNQVRSIDILPTILSIVMIPAPQYIDGRSLKFLMENPNALDQNQILYSEFFIQKAIRTPEWKLIKTVNQTISYELFNLKDDHGEQVNLHGRNIAKEKELKEKLENWELMTNNTYTHVELLNSTFMGYP